MHGTEEMLENYYAMRARVDELERMNLELKNAFATSKRLLSETSKELAIVRLAKAELVTENRQLRAEVKLLSFSKL